jgi:lysophospholipase L1-like esterase
MFVGDLDSNAYGTNGVVDPGFDPHHHGLAGFSNRAILQGGVVPTAPDVLHARGLKEIRVPDLVTVLKQQQPNVVLLMSGSNGFDAPARDALLRTIVRNFHGRLLVAATTPQRAPRDGWKQVPAYNQSLPAIVAELGPSVSMVNMETALTADDLTADGVHPNQTGMNKMARVWFDGLVAAGLVKPAGSAPGAR